MATLRTDSTITIDYANGVVGPQNDNGTILFGGGHQYEIIITKDLGWWNGDWPDCLNRISETILK